MKQTNKLTELTALCVAALLVSTALQTHAQLPWTTLYDAPGHVFTALLDPSAMDPQPSLFIGGNSYRTPTSDPFSVEWVGPFDGGTSPASAVSDSASGVWACYRLGLDPSGTLYSVGEGDVGWQVRTNADGGAYASWQTADTPFAASGQYNSRALGFAADGAGNAFFCGYRLDSNGASHWIVRERNAGGAWFTIKDWSGGARQSYSAVKMHIAGGYLFVVGSAGGMWAVQRMNLANNIWDAPYTGAPKGKKAGAVAVTSWMNDVYMLAWAGRNDQAPESVVLLKSANFGTGSWTIIKTFAESTQINRASDLAFDTGGNPYVVGDSTFYTSAGTWNEAWIVRRWDAGSGVWKWWTPLTNDPALQRSFARQVSMDQAGTVYVTGTAQDIVGGQLSPTWRAIVQKWTPTP